GHGPHDRATGRAEPAAAAAGPLFHAGPGAVPLQHGDASRPRLARRGWPQRGAGHRARSRPGDPAVSVAPPSPTLDLATLRALPYPELAARLHALEPAALAALFT